MKPLHRLLPALALIALTACGSNADLKEKLGLNREGPDEYRVVPRPPLSVPPEFNLRPPGQSSEYVSGMPAQVRARDQVLGTDANGKSAATVQPGGPGSNPFVDTAVVPVTANALPSSSDSRLLADAGASKADPHIRQVLLDDKLNGTGVAKDPNYFFGGKSDSPSQVDAAKEAERIKQDKEQNKPVTTGDTPVVEQPDKGLLGNIFGSIF